MTHIKVCGLTRADDVRLAARLGAWACGFVLSDSPRRVTPERVRELAAEAGAALTVIVVTNETADWIAAALATSRAEAVQLSAGADGPTVAGVRAAAAGRGLRPRLIAAADTPDAAAADWVLCDTRAPGQYGGTGRALDWDELAARRRAGDRAAGGSAPDRGRLILAGGLTPANVTRAIAALRPFAVDVSSGVERAPGTKDARLLAQFAAVVAAADEASASRPDIPDRPDRPPHPDPEDPDAR